MATDRDDTPRDRDSGGRYRGISASGALLIALIAVAVVVAAAVAVYVLLDEDDDASDDLSIGVNTSDVIDEPDAYYDQVVTVSGEVNEVIDQHAITIGAEGFFHDDEMLVISTDGVPIPAEAARDEDETVLVGDLVQVTGTVRSFEEVEVPEEAGWDLDDEAFFEFSGGPVLVAMDVVLNPRVDTPVITPGAEPPVDVTEALEDAVDTTIDEITGNAEEYDGVTATLTGAVDQPTSPRTFILQDLEPEPGVVAGDERMLVLYAEGELPDFVVEGAAVAASGVVHLYDPDDEARDVSAIQIEYGIDIESELLFGWDDEAILIAYELEFTGEDLTTPTPEESG